MAVTVNAYNFKFFNQIRNGEDFSLNTSKYTTNLVGNVGEKVKASFDIDLTWWSSTDDAESWEVYKLTSSTGRIIRTNVFKNTDIAVGDVVEFYNDWVNRDTGTAEFTATIDFISTDNQTIEFTVTSGTQTTTGNTTNAGLWAVPSNAANQNSASYFRFGLIGNNDQFSPASKVSDNDQRYSVTGISRTLSTYSTYNPQGIYQDWRTGTAEIALTSTSKKNTDTFTVNHEFIIVPYFLADEIQNIQDQVPPELLSGVDTLTYSFEIEFRKSANEVSTAKTGLVNNINGSVGWFNENFNGNASDYELVSVVYQDNSDASVIDGVLASGETKVTMIINRIGGNFVNGQNVAVYISYLPENDSEYKNKTTTLIDNFLLDNIIHEAGQPATTGTQPFGSGLFSYCLSTVVSNDLSIVVHLDYTSAQALRFSENASFAIWVVVNDPILGISASDRVSLLIDSQQYVGTSENTIPDTTTDTILAGVDTLNFLRHDQVLGIDTGTTTPTTFNESGLVLDFDFWLDQSLNAVLNELKFYLVAYDSTTGNSFLLDTYTVNLSNVVISGGVQQIEVDTTRGYTLASGDQFNFVKVTTGSLVSTKQHYTGSFAQKITWQRWIKNLNADPVFYDNSEPQNNLNYKASNYSNLSNYQIKMVLNMELTGDDSLGVNKASSFTYRSGNATIFDYDNSTDGTVSATIYTFDESGTNDLGGAILTNANTLFRIVWVKSGVTLPDVDYTIHRIQESNSLGDDISELSSRNTRLVGDILKPIDGESLTKNTLVGSDIHSECLIDYTKLKQGVEYDLSGEIEILSAVNAFWVSGVCELEGVIVNLPTPSIPEFCGDEESSGGVGIHDNKYIATFTGIIYVIFDPRSNADKFEALVNDEEQVVTAVSGTDSAGNFGDPVDGFDADTGINAALDQIWDLPFDAQNKRFLAGDPKTLQSEVWFVSSNTVPPTPTRVPEWETYTGQTLPASQAVPTGDQIIFWSVTAGDTVVERVSGYSPNWNYSRYCIQTG